MKKCYSCIVLVVGLLLACLSFGRGVVCAFDFTSINFYYGENSYTYSIKNESAGNFNVVFERQSAFLKNKKSGFNKLAENMKKSGKSDLEIIFSLLPNFESVYTKMASDIEQCFKETQIEFTPNDENMFNFTNGCDGICIDNKQLLHSIINGETEIEIKTIVQKQSFDADELKSATEMRSSQSTSFAGSEDGRRFNLKKAMATFNGLVVMPNEVVSFNSVLEKRDDGTPYRDAVVILDGVFTYGVGGGICQASTTIYNAVLMAGLEIVEVHRHTLPVGYVEKGFDAMVNDSGVDMKFKNNTKHPIYIKTYAKNDSVYAEVYGENMNGIWYKKVSEKVCDIEPPEAKVIPDTEGKYISRIKYKGEFFTERYAKLGYEVKGYLYTYKGDTLQSIKLIRSGKYQPTQAIIYEGVFENDSETPQKQNA